MQDLDSLRLLIQSHIPLIFIRSREEQRALALITRAAINLGLPVYRWLATEGLQRLETSLPPQRIHMEPEAALGHIRSVMERGLYVLVDFHAYLDHPLLRRLLKDIALGYAQAPRTVILLAPEIEVPTELKGLSAMFELALPGEKELRDIVHQVAHEWSSQQASRRKVSADPQAVDLLVRNLAGLTATDARRLARMAVADGTLSKSDIAAVMTAKYQLLDQGGVLHFEHDTLSFAQVAGLDRLKRWLTQRRPAFLDPKANPALDVPKGILLLGVQGCGKSLAAKAAAGLFGVPLLRLDFGGLYNKYYGETERNVREALKTAEVMAPCVLWLDEIEKGIASGGQDDGLSKRVLGTLLTWMAERRSPVFLAATANDIEQMPPELLRKGRFDEIFFVDLPGAAARAQIFAIQLRARHLDPARFDLSALAAAAEGFSGAELEQAVVAALYSAHARKEELATRHLNDELGQTRPLSVVMGERVQALREWASNRTVSAD
jgi:AAA+ superfamily predicted ATPase